jgi:hypothetical protein
MLNARVQKIVTSSEPQAEIAFLVNVKADDEMDLIAAIADRSERRAMAYKLFREVKAPVISALGHYASDGLHVINTLEGTSQFIAAGPAAAWERAIGEHAELFQGPTISLTPNEAIAVTA